MNKFFKYDVLIIVVLLFMFSSYDKPVDMSPVAEDPCNSPPQTYPGCFGLPYQVTF